MKGSTAGSGPQCGDLSQARASLLAVIACHFVGCDKDFQCMKKPMPGFLKAYTFQLLNPVSNLTGDKNLMESVCVYLKPIIV